jgi:tetratricopeptide (TPR) repeat protein
VRSVASISASPEQRRRQGEKAVDHFTAQLHRPFGKIETLEELAPAIHAIRVYLKLGMSERAAEMYANKGVGFALRFNLEAYNEILELLRPLFPNGWGRRPEVDDEKAAFLAAAAGDAFLGKHHFADAEQAYSTAIMAALSAEDWPFLKRMIGSFSVLENDRFSLCRAWRLYCLLCAFEQAYNQSGCETFDTFSGMILIAAKIGSLELVTEYKNKFGSEWTNDSRGQLYGAGLLFWQDQDPRLQIEGALLSAEEIQDRFAIRNLLDLRGLWHARKEEWLQARDAFEEAVHLARERNLSDAISETGLALAKYHLGQLPEVEEEVERLAQLRRTNHYNLALLCKAIGDLAQAKHHARAAYKQYWGDGEPYVFRYWLERTIELLHQLGEPIPQLPPFDPAKVQPYPWEAEVQAAIDRLNAEKAAKAASAAADEGADSAQED